jgi:hypothetical protein
MVLVLSAFPVNGSDYGVVSIARIRYGGGGDWYTGPTSIPNLLKAASDRVGMLTRPDNIAVRISDHDLFNYPMLFITGHGNIRFEDHEVNRLLTYLDNGGFIWINDSYGLDRYIRRELKKLYPDTDLVLLPSDHPIYNVVYEFPDGLPKIHEHDKKPPAGYALFIKGRMVVYYTHESDIGDGIEDEGAHPDQTAELREQAIRMALNILVYAMTQ